ncbi:hypothetical protein FZEAL_8857 [Fusarium zealandicum]|uniref:Uncharacterized protein n=1 Tax=Fusarium zealandicum TaxID=1053134 RepID=A0A8H4UDM3_9HYPO|nr:hypothetical protein FZEAL_8857 [Fusarium zealandicum]
MLSVLSNISFQYYPLDLNRESNPFIVSWWPLALADPALFHVSIQTASLDEELRARKGFHVSELLMIDSVSLVRRKIENGILAFHDETLNSVVTLAAIEHGKGHVEASRTHIDGVKRIISLRGGIDQIRQTSPLTARMTAWVSMLVTGVPQFPLQDDFGYGDGIAPIPQWSLASTGLNPQDTTLDGTDIDPALGDIFSRLRSIFHQPGASQLTDTELHDLTCFVVHKLLLLPPVSPMESRQSAISECLRSRRNLHTTVEKPPRELGRDEPPSQPLDDLDHLCWLGCHRWNYGQTLAFGPSMDGHLGSQLVFLGGHPRLPGEHVVDEE